MPKAALRPLPIRLLLVTIAAVLVAVAVGWGITQTRANNRSQAFPDASATAKAAGEGPAATVNGVDIPRSAVAGIQSLSFTFPADDINANDPETVIDLLVRQELIRQEAARRGLTPAKAEITAELTQLQQRFQKDLAAGVLPPAEMDVINGLTRTGHPVDKWVDDASMRAAVAAMLTESMLARDETKNLPAPVTDAAIQAAMNQLVARLRQKADIKIFGP